jgi:hypothetical protein
MNLTDQNLKKIKFEILSKFPCYCWIAGGAIVSFLMGQKIKDVDIFFPSEKDKTKGVGALKRLGAKFIHEFPLGAKMKYKGMSFDLVHLGDTPEECIHQFDYTVCAIAVDKDKKFFYHEDFFEHLEKKEIHYTGNHPSKHYTNKAKRMLKYFNKGFTMDQKNLEKWLNSLIKDHKKPQRKY